MSETFGVIILCRYNSTRLPGKILHEINGQSILSIIYQRIKRANLGIEIVVATSNEIDDDPIARKCERLSIPYYRGSLNNVAGRFLRAMEYFNFDYAVRINGDNLFVDYEALGKIIAIAQTGKYDFVTNVPGRTFPKGMSLELLRRTFYSKCYENFSDNTFHTEHVTSWLYENDYGERHILVNNVIPGAQCIDLAIDTQEDLDFAKQIVGATKNRNILLTYAEIVQSISSMGAHNPWQGASGPLLISEIGGNHEGKFEYAKALVQQAIECGSDCVKLQIYQGDTLVSSVESEDRNRHFKKFELSKRQHIELAEMCREAGVKYTASVWDLDMLEWIDEYMSFYKIGSGDMTAWPILKSIALRGKPILLSTGLANMDEVAETISFLQSVNPVYLKPQNLCVLQCTSMYPIPDEEANLSVMSSISEIFGVSVGYSDHTVGRDAMLAAVAMGASVLEFHFTDDREGKEFRDHKVSLTPAEVKDLRNRISQINRFKGTGDKIPQPSEVESGHLTSFRRAVYFKRNLAAGHLVNEEDLIYLRPLHGIDARDSSLIIGKRLTRNVSAFSALCLKTDFLD